MMQQPLPESTQPPEGAPLQPPYGAPPRPPADATQEIAPLWYGSPQAQTQRQPRYPAYPPFAPQPPPEQGPPGSTGADAERSPSARPRRLAELGAIAALAAVLSSAGTYALTRDDLAASPAGQSSAANTSGTTSGTTSGAPVVQADPSAPNWSVTAGVVSPSVVAISVQSSQSSGLGSGVIFDSTGHILTNNHVVAAGGQGAALSVTLNDKRTFDATIVGTDPSTDLAVIKLVNPPKDLKPIALGDAEKVKVGEPVMAVGNPLGLAGTVTTGIVSALNRPVTTSAQGDSSGPGQGTSGEPVVTSAIQTSAAINPGNSGGALVNAGGQLIGINSAIASLGSGGSSSTGGNIGIGFAIPVNEAKSIADQLIKSGKATHAYLGVSSRDGVVAEGSAKRAAAVLTSVAGGTPADKAGLKEGDAIIAVNGDSVDGSLSLVGQVRERTAGDKVTLKVLRDGQPVNITATLTAKPASP
jgi:putative serine protease PepD